MLAARSSVDSPRLRAMARQRGRDDRAVQRLHEERRRDDERDTARHRVGRVGRMRRGSTGSQSGRSPAGSASTCAADHIVYGIEIGDRHLVPGAELPAPTAKLSADPNTPPTIRVTDPSGPIDMLINGMRAFASASRRRREQRQDVGPVAGHHGDLADVAAQPLRFAGSAARGPRRPGV